MVGRAKSDALKAQIARKKRDDLMQQAIELYHSEKEKKSPEKPMSLRKICQTISDAYFAKTQQRIILSHVTLARLGEGGTSLTEHNQSKTWLTGEEETILVDFAISLARRGFPLSPKRLREHAEGVLRARLGDKFPKDGLGKNWATRFITRHYDRIGMYWSSALDTSRGRAVNPITKAEYFQIIKDVRQEYSIVDELVYGADETGIQTGIGVTERVIGPAHAKMQYQQRSGNRENITVLPTICADGTSLPPTVIYKGECFQARWLQDNPLDARLGHQRKGYTSGEIGISWIEDWDELTKKKARGRYRLLVVDGHSSHFTMGFLDHARKNKIIVVCYPSHSTHVYQGLDVVIFSVLKRAWSDERDRFEKSGPVVDKINFLSVYAKAHVRTFTRENILAAFRKTGLVPFNPDVITQEVMAPSLETSTSTLLPLPFTSPVQQIVDLISQHRARKRRHEDICDGDEEIQQSPPRRWAAYPPEVAYTPVRRGVDALASTSASFLVSNSPLASTSHLPPLKTTQISPNIGRDQRLLDREPTTEHEKDLAVALQKSHQVISLQKDVIVGMQAQTILHSMYVEDMRGQLQGKEEKKARSKKKGKINMDGRAKILTQDAIFNMVKEAQAAKDAAKEAAQKRKDAKSKYSEAMEVWRVRETDRKERNAALKVEWAREVKKWEAERDSAKIEKRKPRWTKPKIPPMEKAIPKPKVSDFAEGSDEDEESEEDEDEDGPRQSDGNDSD